jgi:hypothetical protein
MHKSYELRDPPSGGASPAERTLRAKIAAHARWAAEPDRSAATAPARRALDERFEREVDPDGVLPPEERAVRADAARKAHFLRMSLQSAKARRRRKAGRGGDAAA